MQLALVNDELLLERHRLGLDRYDEVHQGMPVLNPAPRVGHQDAALAVANALGTLGFTVSLAINVGQPGDYRIPDVTVYDSDQLHPNGWGVTTALVVVEIISPGEDRYSKLDFYRQLGVDDVLLLSKEAEPELFSSSRAPWGAVPPNSAGDATGRHLAVASPSRSTLVLRRTADDRVQIVPWPDRPTS